MSHSDKAMELAYYLEVFCDKVHLNLSPKDIISFDRIEHFYHYPVYLAISRNIINKVEERRSCFVAGGINILELCG